MADLSLPVPENVLLPTGNRLRMEIPAGAVDVLFLDSLTVRYPRRLTAVGGVLEVTAAAGRCLEFSGFSSPEVLALDVTDPRHPIRLTNAGVTPRSPGYAVRFQDSHAPGDTPRRYLVVERAAAKIPSPLGPVAPITPQAAGILIIAAPEFQDAAARLAVLRQPLAPRVVSPEGIFDALSFSRPSPEAIKAFLQATRALGAPALKHVVLLGGSTVDSNNVLGTSDPDWIPAPFWITSGHGYEAASDGWYVTSEDGGPWAAIGRLAVQSPAEAAGVIDKLAAQPAGASFGENLLVADPDEVTPRERYSFAKAAAELGALMPDKSVVTLLRIDELPDPAAALRAALEAGVDTVHFFGHAYQEGWSSPAILTSSDAGALANPLPFLAFSWSCFDGAFTGPWGDALAWALVRHPTAGAIASVAGSSLTHPASVQLFAREVQRALTAGVPTLGEAVRLAKARLAGLSPGLDDTLATFNLLGDPASPNPWAR
jgi:hypothetical protein